MRKLASLFLVCLAFLLMVSGCSSDMAAENAQTIKIEVKKGTGKATGTIKAASPKTAGMATKRFEFDIPGSYETKGGPSDYMIQFDSSNKAMRSSTTISVDGRVLKRGKDMVWEDDKGPRISFGVKEKEPAKK
jgi:hypothetical protein